MCHAGPHRETLVFFFVLEEVRGKCGQSFYCSKARQGTVSNCRMGSWNDLSRPWDMAGGP